MALVKCKECGEKISKKASSCPKCGAPLKRKTLGCGAFILVLIILGVIGSIVSNFSNSNKPVVNITKKQGSPLIKKIEPASGAQKQHLQSALGDQYPISKIVVLKSEHHKNAYYVGAIFNVTGVGQVTGIWLMGGDKNNPTLLLSVDGAAYEFSRMGKASNTKAAAYAVDPEAIALKDYLKK